MGALDHVKGRHERSGDALDLDIGVAGVEDVAVSALVPWRAEVLLDEVEDVLGGHVMPASSRGLRRKPARGEIGDDGPEPRGADVHTGVFGQDAAEHDETFLLASGDGVLRVLDRFPFANFSGENEVGVRQRIEHRGNRRHAGEHDDTADAGLRVPDYADARAGLEAAGEVVREGADGGRWDVITGRVAPGLVLAPAHGVCEADGEGVRLAGAPGVREAEDHEAVLLDEIFLAPRGRGPRG